MAGASSPQKNLMQVLHRIDQRSADTVTCHALTCSETIQGFLAATIRATFARYNPANALFWSFRQYSVPSYRTVDVIMKGLAHGILSAMDQSKGTEGCTLCGRLLYDFISCSLVAACRGGSSFPLQSLMYLA